MAEINVNNSGNCPAIRVTGCECIPDGGTTGQVLAKASDTDYDVEWVNQSGGGGGSSVTSVNGQTGAVVLDAAAVGALPDNTVIPTVPTIDTSIDEASVNTEVAGALAVYEAVHPAIVTSQPAGGMLPNVLYELGTLSGSVTITFATPADSSIANHYYFTFDADSTAPTITWPADITSWYGGSAPTINASKHYEVSVLSGVAVCMEV